MLLLEHFNLCHQRQHIRWNLLRCGCFAGLLLLIEGVLHELIEDKGVLQDGPQRSDKPRQVRHNVLLVK